MLAGTVLMLRRWLLLGGSGFLCGMLAGAAPARAQTTHARGDEAEARFEEGAREWNLSFGQGLGLGLFGSDGEDAEDVRFLGLVPRFGLGLSGPLAPEAWYRGSLELLVEGALLVAHEPKGGFIGGASLALRYNLLSWRRLVPFVELGVGLAHLELDLASQSDGLSFTPQGGLGLHWWLSPRSALTMSWRLHHLSNAGIGDDNVGINSSLLLVGFSYFPRSS